MAGAATPPHVIDKVVAGRYLSFEHGPVHGGSLGPLANEMRAMSPADFERAFLKEMIGHHRAAIAPAKDCEKNASHGELRRLCRGMVKSQTMEIRIMHRWLCNWYGNCPGVVAPEPQPAIAA